jgi:hypothetical protein
MILAPLSSHIPPFFVTLALDFYGISALPSPLRGRTRVGVYGVYILKANTLPLIPSLREGKECAKNLKLMHDLNFYGTVVSKCILIVK